MNEESFEKNTTEHNQSVILKNGSSRAKKADHNLIINTMGIFNDEAFDSIIKDFLNINDFPSDPKEKILLLRKFISIYKKIKSDKNKLNNFMKKFSEKLNEPIEEINVSLSRKKLKFLF